MKFWHEVDGLLLRQAANHADDIRDALIRSVPVDEIVNRWADSRTAGEKVTTAEARDWANRNIDLPERPLKDALDRIYATGWVLGDDVAVAAYANARYNLKKAAPSGEQLSAAISVNWDNWKPGNRAAEALVRPPGGLKALLEKADATVSEANTTTLNRIGTLLADSLSTGGSYDSLARALLRDDITQSVIKDASRAQMIAVTEMSRALNTSTVDNYGQFGVEMVEWLAIDTGVCEICPANEAQGPIKLGDVFDSGDEAPPAHPNCRCTILPVVDEGAADNLPTEAEPDLSTFEMEISDVADHSVDDIAATVEPALAQAAQDFTRYANLTPTQQEAFNEYIGNGFYNMNTLLRTGKVRRDIEKWQPLVDAFSNVVKGQPATVEAATKYRGVWGPITDKLRTMKAGDTFQDAGFMSTSARADVATNFQYDNPGAMTMRIEVPAGTVGLDVKRFKLDNALGEQEFILPPGTTLQVVSNKVNEIVMRVIQ